MTKRIAKRILGIFTAREYFRLKAIALTMLAAFVCSILLISMVLENAELSLLDYRFRARPEKTGLSDVVLIDMADDSIHQIGRWPWPREWHATLIDILSQYKARMIVFDVLFTEKADEASDNALQQAIRDAGTVYLPNMFETIPGEGLVLTNALPIFAKYAKGMGNINVFPDRDGSIRRIPLVFRYGDSWFPHLTFKLACDYLGIKKEDIVVHPGKSIEIKASSKGPFVIPVDKDNQMFVNWTGKWEGGSFKHYSYMDIIVSYQQIQSGQKPRVDLNELRNRICLVGLTATGLIDIKPMPLEPLYPAVGAHANVIDTIVMGHFIHRIPAPINIAILFLFCLLMSWLVPVSRPLTGFLLTLLVLVAYICIAFYLFVYFEVWINIVYTALAVIMSYLAIALYNQITTAMEKARLFHLATQDGLTGLYVIRHFSLLLEAQMLECKETGAPLSIIMSDIDHFKKFNDTYGHQTGDFVLREVAKIFKTSSRQLDVAGRYGGEEFIVMLPKAPLESARNAAERLRKSIESTVFKDPTGQTYKVTVSLGVAALVNDSNKEEFIKRADAALYQAKEAGRNRVCCSEST